MTDSQPTGKQLFPKARVRFGETGLLVVPAFSARMYRQVEHKPLLGGNLYFLSQDA